MAKSSKNKAKSTETDKAQADANDLTNAAETPEESMDRAKQSADDTAQELAETPTTPPEEAPDEDKLSAEEPAADMSAGENSGTEKPAEDTSAVDQSDTESTDAQTPAPEGETIAASSVPENEADTQSPEKTEQPDASTPTDEPPSAPSNDIVAVPATTEEKGGGGFIPQLLGGVVAGGIGFAIATYVFSGGGDDSGDLAAQIEAQADQLAALETQVEGIPQFDPSDLQAQIDAISDETGAQLAEALGGIDERLSGLDDRLGAFDARLIEVEKRPSSDGTLSETAMAAYQRELEQLRAEIDAQQVEVMAAATRAEEDLATARAEAEQFEQEARAAAQAAVGRAALNRVATAVETGAPFADALADLATDDVPAALADAAESGVATTAELVADFPDTARAALAAARSGGQSDDAGGVGGFLRSQFDVRSTTPREGDGPDAVLSRAEAAVKEGRIADALAEIEALPEVARAEMTDWTARASERADVLAAIATLSETYN